MSEEKVDLSMTLDAVEIGTLVGRQLVPSEYVGLDLDVVQAGAGVGSDGRVYVQVVAALPAQALTPTSRLVAANGSTPSPLDGAMPLPPRVRVVLDASRLSEAARSSLQAMVEKKYGDDVEG